MVQPHAGCVGVLLGLNEFYELFCFAHLNQDVAQIKYMQIYSLIQDWYPMRKALCYEESVSWEVKGLWSNSVHGYMNILALVSAQ